MIKNSIRVLACAITGIFALGSGPHDAKPQPADQRAPSQATAPSDTVTPDAALSRLIAGNQRFVSETPEHARAKQARRCDTVANGQHPFATVLACADSRVPVELLFDQGIGDLFVIRVAGNVSDTDEIGTIEYGVGHLHSPLVVVMGHTKCGAVTAVVDGAKLPKNIASLVDNIIPAAEKTKAEHADLRGEPLVSAAVENNVFQSMADLFRGSEEVRHLASTGKAQVVGAVYDLHSGSVRWLGRHPDESKLLSGAPTADAGHDAHDTPKTKPAGNHDTHGDAIDKHAAIDKDEHSSAAPAGSSSSNSSGRSRSLWIPAAFLGGAGAVSTAVIYRMKPVAKIPAPETPEVPADKPAA
ncbi:hypothetical protein BH09PLA1_BH09PLA1_21070 [soil metagenome]